MISPPAGHVGRHSYGALRPAAMIAPSRSLFWRSGSHRITARAIIWKPFHFSMETVPNNGLANLCRSSISLTIAAYLPARFYKSVRRLRAPWAYASEYYYFSL